MDVFHEGCLVYRLLWVNIPLTQDHNEGFGCLDGASKNRTAGYLDEAPRTRTDG